MCIIGGNTNEVSDMQNAPMKLMMCTKPGMNEASPLQRRQMENRIANRGANELLEFMPNLPSRSCEHGDTNRGMVTNTTKTIAIRTDVGSHVSGSSCKTSP